MRTVKALALIKASRTSLGTGITSKWLSGEHNALQGLCHVSTWILLQSKEGETASELDIDDRKHSWQQEQPAFEKARLDSRVQQNLNTTGQSQFCPNRGISIPTTTFAFLNTTTSILSGFNSRLFTFSHQPWSPDTDSKSEITVFEDVRLYICTRTIHRDFNHKMS